MAEGSRRCAEQNPVRERSPPSCCLFDPAKRSRTRITLLSDGSGADRGFREPDRGQYDTAEEVFGACGASVLYRRQMLEDWGYSTRRFHVLRGHRPQLGMRLRGWSVLYEPDAVVDHVHAGSSREWSPFSPSTLIAPDLRAAEKCIAPDGDAILCGPRAARSETRRPARSALADLARVGRPAMAAVPHLPQSARLLLLHFPEMMLKRLRIRWRRTAPMLRSKGWFVPREQWAAREDRHLLAVFGSTLGVAKSILASRRRPSVMRFPSTSSKSSRPCPWIALSTNAP